MAADEPDLLDLDAQPNAADVAPAPAPPAHHVLQVQPPPPADIDIAQHLHHHVDAPPAALQPQLQQQQQQQQEEQLPPEIMEMMMGDDDDMAPEPEQMHFFEFDLEADNDNDDGFHAGFFGFWAGPPGQEDNQLHQQGILPFVPGAGNLDNQHPMMHAAADPALEEMRRYILGAGDEASKGVPKPIRRFCNKRPHFNNFLTALGKFNGKIKKLAAAARLHPAAVSHQMRDKMELLLAQKDNIIARILDGMDEEKNCKNNFPPASGRRRRNHDGDDGPSGAAAMA